MPTNLITAGTTVAQSDDFDLAVADEAHIHLFAPGFSPAVPHVTVSVLVKDSQGGYTEVMCLDQDKISGVIQGQGTYAVRRGVCALAVGVDRD
jgi:hypothetical protein